MAWVADTCLLIDVAEADPAFGVASAALIDSKRAEGLAVCPITYAELAPVFGGDATAQNEFLANSEKRGPSPTRWQPSRRSINT